MRTPIIAILVLTWPQIGLADSMPNLSIEVKVEYKKGELKFSLKNMAEKELRCHAFDLPWSHWHSLTLILVDDLGNVIPAPTFFDCPVLGTVALKQNESLKGEVQLKDRFPTIERVLLKRGVDVFWSYRLRSIDGRRSQRLGGWLHIPQARK